MSLAVRIIDYYYLRIRDEPGKAYELLAQLAREEINLVAFSAVPYGAHGVELTLFPDRPEGNDKFHRIHTCLSLARH